MDVKRAVILIFASVHLMVVQGKIGKKDGALFLNSHRNATCQESINGVNTKEFRTVQAENMIGKIKAGKFSLLLVNRRH